MQVEYADLSLLGGREENQDRVAVAVAEHAVLLVVVDGMGGHADGARAAETTIRVLLDAFAHVAQPVFDPLGFLHLGLGKAHEEVVRLGLSLPLDKRPRATCAVCLVQHGSAYFAHVGDSRIYWLRQGNVVTRTRDHSHVELLLREGLITAEQAHNHPMRNYVECCLGGDPVLPDMTMSRRHVLSQGDVLLVCSDGVWGGFRDQDIAASLADDARPLSELLTALSLHAVKIGGPVADNASAAALRFRG